MTDDIYNDELVEKYLLGELKGIQLDEFNRKLASDDKFRNEVALQKALIQNIKAVGRKKWALKLEGIHNEMNFTEEETAPTSKSIQPVKRIFNRKHYLAAAAIVGIIALGITWYIQNRKENTSTVAINNKTAPGTKNNNAPDTTATQKNIGLDTSANQDRKKEAAPVKRLNKAEQVQLAVRNFKPDSIPGKAPEFLEEAFNHYKKGDYKEASQEYEQSIAVAEKLNIRTSDEEEKAEQQRILLYAHYYNALSYMAQGNAIKSIAELNGIKKSPDGYWQSKIQWYLALAYLRTGKAEKAMALLQQVAGSKQAGEYRQKAVQLSEALQ